jgi:hypothetical protein
MSKTCKTYQRDWDVCIDAALPCARKSHTERERCMQTETETHCLGFRVKPSRSRKLLGTGFVMLRRKKNSHYVQFVSERMW